MLLHFHQVLPAAIMTYILTVCTLEAPRRATSALVQASNESRLAMRSLWCVAIVLLLVSKPVSISAQQPSSPASSQPNAATADAKSAINTAVKQLGDEPAVRSLDSCVVTGTIKQGAAAGVFTWKIAAHESWSETNVDSVHIVAASNHGKPLRLVGGKIRELSRSTLANPDPIYGVGMSLLRSRDDATLTLDVSSVAATTVAEIHITHVKPTDPDMEATHEVWTFDQQTGLPASHILKPMVYRGRPLAWTTSYEFSDYRDASGVKVPHHIEQRLNDQMIRSFDIQTIRCGVAFSDHDFEVSGGPQ